MSSHLEFDNWRFCLDTGHLVNTFPDAYSESICTERLPEIFSRYPDEMRERIGTVHLRLSTSAEYRSTFERVKRFPGETMADVVSRSYPHIRRIDQHRPFSTCGCRLLVDEISQDFVTREMVGPRSERVIGDFIQQRSFFPMQ